MPLKMVSTMVKIYFLFIFYILKYKYTKKSIYNLKYIIFKIFIKCLYFPLYFLDIHLNALWQQTVAMEINENKLIGVLLDQGLYFWFLN